MDQKAESCRNKIKENLLLKNWNALFLWRSFLPTYQNAKFLIN
mgnify:CR=1 FL=1